MKFSISNFLTNFSGWGILWNCSQMNVAGTHWWLVNIDSGNGLVLSGNKPLPEPMLTQISVAMASQDHDDLKGIFWNENYCILIQIPSGEVYFIGSSWCHVNIGMDNDLRPSMQQDITRTNVEKFHVFSSGWSRIWFNSITGLSITQYEQIPTIFRVWLFVWLYLFDW